MDSVYDGKRLAISRRRQRLVRRNDVSVTHGGDDGVMLILEKSPGGAYIF